MAVSLEHFSHVDLDTVLDLLAPVGVVEQQARYGGRLLSVNDVPVALWRDSVLYLKADGGVRERLIAAGIEPLCPFPGRSLRLHYYPLPADWLGDPLALQRQVREAVEQVRALQRAVPQRRRFRARRVDKAPWQ